MGRFVRKVHIFSPSLPMNSRIRLTVNIEPD